MATRSIAVTAAVATGAALVATGITYASAASEPAQAAAVNQQAAAVPAAAPQGGGGNSKGNEGKDYGYGHGKRRHHIGLIHINERTYAAHAGGCITVVSGLGSKSLNVRNDSWKTVEVFNGATCDNGSPVATVGPYSSSNGLYPRRVRGGLRVRDGVVGSFRVVGDYFRYGYDHGRGDYGK
ncbi:hypothetical protein [Streptomyces sp. NPDC007264]|uniref:hypothetical protein n=1 Tax=Streptomyces sp. NPDC007264 TaxID=3364777 RepID=UPI0036D96285